MVSHNKIKLSIFPTLFVFLKSLLIKEVLFLLSDSIFIFVAICIVLLICFLTWTPGNKHSGKLCKTKVFHLTWSSQVLAPHIILLNPEALMVFQLNTWHSSIDLLISCSLE